MNATLVSSRDR